MSDFLESVDDMIAGEYALDAKYELKKILTADPGDWAAAEKALYRLICCSIAHARNQVARRGIGTMTFDEAMHKVRIRNAMVTRPAWNVFRVILRHQADEAADQLWAFQLDNCDGDRSGSGSPYRPSDDDRAARDWMPYQPPAENWIELKF